MSRGGSAMRPVSSFTLPSGWVTRVAATEDFQALSTVAAELADHIGFTGVTYSLHDMTLRRSATSETPMAWFANYPEAWIKRYVARDYARYDPVILAAAQGRPFRWGDLDVDAMTAVQRAVLTEARDFGLHDGFCVPARTGRTLGLFNALAAGSEAERRDALAHGTESLAALGLVVHERARHLLLRAGGAILWDLPQEALIALEQLAAGAEASEAAAAMKISERTFESLMDDLVRHLKPPKIAGLRMSALTLRFSRSRHPHANGIETAASRRDGGGS